MALFPALIKVLYRYTVPALYSGLAATGLWTCHLLPATESRGRSPESKGRSPGCKERRAVPGNRDRDRGRGSSDLAPRSRHERPFLRLETNVYRGERDRQGIIQSGRLTVANIIKNLTTSIDPLLPFSRCLYSHNDLTIKNPFRTFTHHATISLT